MVSFDLALASGVFKKASTRVELPNGKTEFGKTINNNPENTSHQK